MLISQVNSGGYGTPTISASTQAAQPVVSTSSNQPSTAVELPQQAVQAVDTLLSADQVKDAVNQVNKVVQTMAKDLLFSVDSDTGIHVVTVMDTSTKEVIRQFPSKEVVELAKTLDKLQGLIIRQAV